MRVIRGPIGFTMRLPPGMTGLASTFEPQPATSVSAAAATNTTPALIRLARISAPIASVECRGKRLSASHPPRQSVKTSEPFFGASPKKRTLPGEPFFAQWSPITAGSCV